MDSNDALIHILGPLVLLLGPNSPGRSSRKNITATDVTVIQDGGVSISR